MAQRVYFCGNLDGSTASAPQVVGRPATAPARTGFDFERKTMLTRSLVALLLAPITAAAAGEFNVVEVSIADMQQAMAA
jgi:hypothetical protein